ncbi:MAG: protein kinase [Polyangiales bacterium]
MSSESPLLFGRYQLLELIARGGMAEVFKAKSYGVEGFEKQVVLKRILPGLAQNQQFVDMFLHEARLSVALSHANIVQVFDLGREEDTYFIAMEYVRGADMAQVLRDCRREGRDVPVEIAVYIACEVARALDYAHRRRDAHGQSLGVVHRDISPQNVLLSSEGEVKVTDFGIAKARNTIEAQGTIRGKYGYMSPEQARGEAVDARADVYALGVTLFEALAGQNPFAPTGATPPRPQDVLARVLEGRHPPLKQFRPDAPDEIVALLDATMSLDVAKRPSTAAKLYEELTAFLYTLGTRVGPNDLAEWLKDVREAGPSSVVDVRGIQAAFDDFGGEALGPEIEEIDEEVEIEEVAEDEPPPAKAGSSMRPLDERRPVVMLAAQLTGASASLVQTSLDAMVTSADRRAATVLDRREGAVVLAFGVRSPDGREVTHATRVALTLQQIASRAAPGASLGIGLVTARVRLDADGQPVDDDALVESIGAARALALTARDRVLTSPALAGAVAEGFETEALSDGGARVIEARAEVRRRVVGRQAPFKLFGEVLARAATQGLQVVEVVGEAGVGKTRFLEEVHYRLRRQNHKVTWHVATCLSHERDIPLAAMQAMLRELLGIEEVDPEAVVREKARRVRELGLTPEEMLAVGVVLGVVSASIESIDSASRPLRSAMQKIATRLAEDRITVLAWDSAEHMDDLSATLLAELVERAAKSRLVVVTAARRGRRLPWHAHASATRAELEPLTEDETWQLVAQQLGTGVLPGDLVDDLWEKTRGNPFALEEYLKALLDLRAVVVGDEGVFYNPSTLEGALPDTLRGMVASRVARLPSAQRKVLQVAAVIGLSASTASSSSRSRGCARRGRQRLRRARRRGRAGAPGSPRSTASRASSCCEGALRRHRARGARRAARDGGRGDRAAAPRPARRVRRAPRAPPRGRGGARPDAALPDARRASAVERPRARRLGVDAGARGGPRRERGARPLRGAAAVHRPRRGGPRGARHRPRAGAGVRRRRPRRERGGSPRRREAGALAGAAVRAAAPDGRRGAHAGARARDGRGRGRRRGARGRGRDAGRGARRAG